MAAGHESVLIEQIIGLRDELRLSDERAAQRTRDLDRVLEAEANRDVIEQAKGMLMGRSPDLSADEALALLVVASERENMRVREIALRIVGRQVVED
jgi:AmiR/NasT family two-component response regulator